MNKKGFTIIELIATLTILAIILAITFPIIGSVVRTSQQKACILDAGMMEKAARNYASIESINIKQGETHTIPLTTLQSSKYISAVLSPSDRTTPCEGYVNVTNQNGVYKYRAYLKCTDVCQTAGYNDGNEHPQISDNTDLQDKNGAKYYVGANPNNWVKFGRISQSDNRGFLWRIIKIDDDGIKMVFEGLENDGAQPAENGRVVLGGTTGIAWDAVGTNKWENPASLKGKLNSWVSTMVVNNISDYTTSINWHIGGVPYQNPTNIATFLTYEGIDSNDVGGSFKGLTADKSIVGLANASDFISTSSNITCTSSYKETGSGNECAEDTDGSLNNFLYKPKYHWWTMNARSDVNNKAWIVNNAGQVATSLTNSSIVSVRPVINIKKDVIYYDGNGTIESPYILEEYMVGLIDKPVITLNGTNPFVMKEGDTYIEPGATAVDSKDGDISSSIRIESDVNPSLPGTYHVTYNVKDSDGNDALPITREVVVVPKDTPVLNLIGDNPMYVTLNHAYTEPGATAYDLNDGDISSNIVISGTVDTSLLGTYDITYNVTNSQGKAAIEVIRKVIVEVPKPVITLNGDANVLVGIGGTYTDAGATATDEIDGDLTPNIITTIYSNNIEVSSINTAQLGSYKIKYQVTNSLGGSTTVYRYVNIVSVSGPTVTYNPNGDTTPKRDNQTKVTVTQNIHPVDYSSLKYLWIGDYNYTGDLDTIINNPFSNNDSLSVPKGTNRYSLYIIAKDTYGDETISKSNSFLMDNYKPNIYLKGSHVTNILINSSYVDAGASAFDYFYDGDITDKIQITSDVNPSVAGIYHVTYTVTDTAGNTTTATRTVNVNNPVPLITLNGSNYINVRIDTPYIDQGAKATDPIDGDISANIIASGIVNTSKAGIYTITYSVTNSFGVTTTSTRTVNVYIPKPVITILGNNPTSILLGNTYSDAGATATDEIDGNLTSSITVQGTINPSVIGTYKITYSVTNSYNQTATATRTVNVRNPIITITLNGNNPYVMDVGEIYVELGATAIDEKDGDITNSISTTTNLNPNIVGNYTVTYTATDSVGVSKSISRSVRVVPLEGPTITITPNGNSAYAKYHNATVKVTANKKPVDETSLKYLWSTSYYKPSAGEFTEVFTNNETIGSPNGFTGSYFLYILAKDTEGNTSILRSNLYYLDNTAPVLTIKGDTVMEVPVDATYNDPGVTVVENHSGLNSNGVVVTSNIVPGVMGTYQVTYDTTDKAGNVAVQVKRTVVVRQISLVDSVTDFTPKYYADYFVGSNPHNWIEFGTVSQFDDRPYLWRIVRSDTQGIKIIYEGVKKTDNTAPDEDGKAAVGSSLMNPYDTNNSNKWDAPASLRSPLQTWYDSIYDPDKNTLTKAINWCIGGINYPYTIDDFKNTECTTQTTSGGTFSGKTSTTTAVGLINSSDYMLSSMGTCDAYNATSCGLNNYLSKSYNYLTINADSASSSNVFEVKSSGGLSRIGANVNSYIRPVVNLKSDVLVLSGDGTLESPYKLNTRVPIVDNDPPVITFTPNAGAIYKLTYDVEIVAADDISGIQQGTLKYVWTTSTTQPSESAITNAFANGDRIPMPSGVTGTYYLWAIAKDNKNNSVIQGSGAFKVDNQAPVITINGDNPYSVVKGDAYADPGATATDNVDGDLTSKMTITSNVNPSAVGTYYVTYSVTDTAGNTTTATRSIVVEIPGLLADKISGKISPKNGSNYFAGANPTNWIQFGQASSTDTTPLMWRIISSDSNGIKIIYEGKYNGSSAPTANGSIGNNTWDSSTLNKWERPATIKTTLSNWYDTTLVANNKESYVNPVKWCIGGATTPYDMSTECITQNAAGGTFTGMTSDYAAAGLLSGRDYISASDSTLCTNGNQAECGGTHNFLDRNYQYWLINAYSGNGAASWFVATDGPISYYNTNVVKGTRPVINLRTDVLTLKGDGSMTNPYIIKASSNPYLRLIGDSSVEVALHGIYTDPGIYAYDDKDGDISSNVTVTSNINVNVAGTYTVTYNVTDSDGNAAIAITRTVKVLGETLLAEKISPSLATKNGSNYFTGANPNNWIQFGQASSTDTTPLMWRIVNSDSNGIKIVYEGKYNINLAPTANGSIGNNTWDSSNLNKWERPATIKTTLSNWYNTTLVANNKQAYVNPVKWCIGGVTTPYDMSTECITQNTAGGTFVGMTSDYAAAGLLNGRDYISTSDSTLCTNGSQVECGGTSNFLDRNYQYWLINAFSGNGGAAWYVAVEGHIANYYGNVVKGTRPVVNLRADTLTLKGDGSMTNPYIISANSKPYLRLIGDSSVEVMLHDTYTDPGIYAYDDKDGDISSSVTVTSNVNINVAGTYTVTYNVTDSDGITATSVTRTVKVLGETLLSEKISPSLTAKNGSDYFTGANPNNWIQFGQTSSTDTTPLMWRIISSDSNGIKIIYEGKYNINLGPTANGSIGNNVWDSSTLNKWERPSSMKTYLSNWYNNTLVANNKQDYVNPTKWCIGGVASPYDISTECVTQTTAGGTFAGMTSDSSPIGLINGRDYISTSDSTLCTNGSQVECGGTSNFLDKNYIYWLINANSGNGGLVWYVTNNGNLSHYYANVSYGIRPVVNLKADILTLKGDGSMTNPYIIRP